MDAQDRAIADEPEMGVESPRSNFSTKKNGPPLSNGEPLNRVQWWDTEQGVVSDADFTSFSVSHATDSRLLTPETGHPPRRRRRGLVRRGLSPEHLAPDVGVVTVNGNGVIVGRDETGWPGTVAWFCRAGKCHDVGACVPVTRRTQRPTPKFFDTVTTSLNPSCTVAGGGVGWGGVGSIEPTVRGFASDRSVRLYKRLVIRIKIRRDRGTEQDRASGGTRNDH